MVMEKQLHGYMHSMQIFEVEARQMVSAKHTLIASGLASRTSRPDTGFDVSYCTFWLMDRQ